MRASRAPRSGPRSPRKSTRSKVEWRVAARKNVLKAMSAHDREIESRKASVRAKGEHPFLVVKRDFGFTKTRYHPHGPNQSPSGG